MTRTLTIFGINGRTGRELARTAGAQGWHVRGFVRPTSDRETDFGDCRIVRGSFAEAERVVAAVDGSDAVCCVLGPRPPYTEVFCAEATAAILAAMARTGSRRLVCLTGAMIGPAPNRSRAMEWMARTYARRQPEAARDRLEQERLVEAADLEWTLVKPPRLTDAPPSGRVQAGTALPVGLLSRIGRADLAAFLLDEAEAGRFVRQCVFVKG